MMRKIIIHRGGKAVDSTYSKYDQAMEALKVAQGLIDKIRTPSSSKKSSDLFRQGASACEKAAKLWEEASKETPQFAVKYQTKADALRKDAHEFNRRATGDASNKFVTKKDLRLPVDPALGRRSGGVLPLGTVVYKEGSGYRPWFINGSFRLDISSSDLVSGTMDAGGSATSEQINEARRLVLYIEQGLKRASALEKDDMETVLKGLRSAKNWLS